MYVILGNCLAVLIFLLVFLGFVSFVNLVPKVLCQAPMKYILLWDYVTPIHYSYIRLGEVRDCLFRNCFFRSTNERPPEMEYEEYDAILFDANSIKITTKLPEKRNANQRYIFSELESMMNMPLCRKYHNNFFNWTATYKLDSDMPWTYFQVKDKLSNTIGPAINVPWIQDMLPIPKKLETDLLKKSKLVAWFVSNCSPGSQRMKFAKQLDKELKRYHEQIDIYGKCGRLTCPKDDAKCDAMIQNEYMFYFAAENSIAEDYVTEKVLTALNNKAIPIVYGGADYKRFLPPGSYIDSRELGPANLAKLMMSITDNLDLYFSYFKWYNHYYFYNGKDKYDNLKCLICTRLNQDTTPKSYKHIRKWWNKNFVKTCMELGERID